MPCSDEGAEGSLPDVPILQEQMIGAQRIILGDCLKVLPALGRFDVVVTDPPYGISHSSNKGASWKGRQIANDQDTLCRDLALAGFANVAAFGTWKTPPIDDCKGAIVWDKGPAVGMGDLSFPWKGSFDLIYIRGSIWRGRRDEGVLRGHTQVSWESRGRVHPHQKPLSLIIALLQKTPPGSTVLDPFLGSGTTLVACQRMGRSGTGIEIDQKHFDEACRRVEAELREPGLFANPLDEGQRQEDLDL